MPRAPSESNTRSCLVAAMCSALQRRGFHGVGLAELLADAQAPKGVLYHHFPGGKTELAVVPIAHTGAHVAAPLDALAPAGTDLIPLLRGWRAGARQQLERSHFERGCPLATVALESTADDTGIRAALAQAFATIREELTHLLATAGMAAARSPSLATLAVATYEGALLQARVAGHGHALTDTAEALIRLVEADIRHARGET